MARPDLPEGYDGWQIIDATPQESSDGMSAIFKVNLSTFFVSIYTYECLPLVIQLLSVLSFYATQENTNVALVR